MSGNRVFFDNPVQGCYVSVDGTDFGIDEPKPFSAQWYSHKLNRAGLRYGVCIWAEIKRIVWASGPCPACSHSDVKIFREALKPLLGQFEFVIADCGYTDT